MSDSVKRWCGRYCWLAVPLLFVLLELAGLARDGFRISGDAVDDADTLMRLSYLREWLQTGHWTRGFFDRNNAPYGMVLHWSLPFDLAVLTLDRLFAGLGPDAALQYAGYWTGPVFRLVACLVAYWAARAIMSRSTAIFAAGMIVFANFYQNYAHRGSANHHSLLYLLTIAMAGFGLRLIVRRSSIDAILAGILCGVSIWVSPELIVVVVPLLALIYMLWALEGGPRRLAQAALVSAAFSATVTLALLVDPPYEGISAVFYDHISIPYVTFADLTLVIAIAASNMALPQARQRVAFLIAAGLGAAGFWITRYPSAVHGIEGTLDPYVKREWLSQIVEVMPLGTFWAVVFNLGTGILSLLLIVVSRESRERKEGLFGGFIFLIVAAELHFRLSGYLLIASGFYLGYCLDMARRDPGFFRRAGKWIPYGALTLFLLVYGSQVATEVFYVDLEPSPSSDDDDKADCSPYDVRGALNDTKWLKAGRPDPIIAGEFNFTPPLLYWTGVRTLAGNYHRDSQGIKDNYLFLRDVGDKTARKIAHDRGLDFVLVCGDGSNFIYSFATIAEGNAAYARDGENYTPEETLYYRLADERPPSWLKLRPWPEGTESDLVLYQVDRTKLGTP